LVAVLLVLVLVLVLVVADWGVTEVSDGIKNSP
jgi:hypothetical protein